MRFPCLVTKFINVNYLCTTVVPKYHAYFSYFLTINLEKTFFQIFNDFEI